MTVLKKLGLVDLQKGIQDKLKEHTDTKCFDVAPVNEPAPLYYVEVVAKRDASSKNMWREVFTVWIHAIAETNKSKEQVYTLIQEAEEALTEEISLPEGFELMLQSEQGLQTIKEDESGEYHAVLAYEFMVSYGFKCK